MIPGAIASPYHLLGSSAPSPSAFAHGSARPLAMKPGPAQLYQTNLQHPGKKDFRYARADAHDRLPLPQNRGNKRGAGDGLANIPANSGCHIRLKCPDALHFGQIPYVLDQSHYRGGRW